MVIFLLEIYAEAILTILHSTVNADIFCFSFYVSNFCHADNILTRVVRGLGRPTSCVGFGRAGSKLFLAFLVGWVGSWVG